jgi:flagellar hook-associated protein 1 FlgK
MAAIPNVMQTAQSGMMASKAAIATTSHNITNANTEGYSKQHVEFAADVPPPSLLQNSQMGRGVLVSRIERSNDSYLDKQIRTGNQEQAQFEEKDVHLNQVEDIFNEMGGEGLNRMMAQFFNEFRKLANDPESEAVRQSVREASQAMVTDFKRLRKEVQDVSKHIDSRLEGYSREVNSLVTEIRNLNQQIVQVEGAGRVREAANDLKDKRDLALKNLSSYMNITTHEDEHGALNVDIPGIGPLITGSQGEKFEVERSPANAQGKLDGALDLRTGATASNTVTSTLKGGKMGALLEVRDKTVNTILERLDDMAFTIANAVNEIHEQGFTREGVQGVRFFNKLTDKNRAAEYLDLSDAVKGNVNNIAAAAQLDAPGDNRIALAVSGIQNLRVMNGGKASIDDYYNSIVSDVGVLRSRNRADMKQQQGINSQLSKMRDQLAGVSLDEETTNLLQYQHSFDASAKVIQVADEMLNTVLNLKRL